MRYYFTPVRMAITKKTRNINVGQCRGKGTLCTADGNVSWYSHMEHSKHMSQKIRNRTTIEDSVIPLLGMYLKEMKSPSLRDICTPLLLVAKTWEQPEYPGLSPNLPTLSLRVGPKASVML